MVRSILVLLLIAAVRASSGISTPEEYWHAILPHTPIPVALRSLLPSDAKPAAESSLWGVGVTVGEPGVRVVVQTPGSGGVNVNVNPFFYQYGPSKIQVHDFADVALFFLEKDLFPGSKMNLHFKPVASGVPFWPRSAADSLPFSSARLSDILSGLSIKPNSKEAAIISRTLQTCEAQAVKGETRFCATSLESMVDFVTASLGSRDLQALSTEVSKSNSVKQAYYVAPSGVKKLGKRKVVACHALSFAYAVYFCHTTRATRLYLVSLEGEDGTWVEAVVACHTDTSSWNPKHIAFQLLKVSPGKVPVCHFLPQDHVLWSRRP